MSCERKREIVPNGANMNGLVTKPERDHGGGLDQAVAAYGGARIGWLDLSTGINPVPYETPPLSADAWTALPDKAALEALTTAARGFWSVPNGAGVLAAPGASSLIAQIPALMPAGRVAIPAPTYNEHAAAFAHHGWHHVAENSDGAQAQVVVHPNNPDGRCWSVNSLPLQHAALTVIDESFCDVMPDRSCVNAATNPGTLILKSFGKFWGLAGLRLGFVIGDPALVSMLAERLGPWAVSGPALDIGAAALADETWAAHTRERLAQDSARLDGLMRKAGATVVGGTDLFRLYEVNNGAAWQDRLARHHIWTRVFPYNPRWLRLGLPPVTGWDRVAAALA